MYLMYLYIYMMCVFTLVFLVSVYSTLLFSFKTLQKAGVKHNLGRRKFQSIRLHSHKYKLLLAAKLPG